jgi:hypothetical protein
MRGLSPPTRAPAPHTLCPRPLPFAPTLAAVRLVERLGIPFPLRSESLLGIKALHRLPVADDLRRLDLRIRSANQNLAVL